MLLLPKAPLENLAAIRSIIVTRCAGGPRNTAQALLTNTAAIEWLCCALLGIPARWEAIDADDAFEDELLLIGGLLVGWNEVVEPPMERRAWIRAWIAAYGSSVALRAVVGAVGNGAFADFSILSSSWFRLRAMESSAFSRGIEFS